MNATVQPPAPAGAAFNPDSPRELRDAWHALTAQKSLRIRDAAQQLGVAEAQLLATGIGEHVIRLQGDWRDLMMRMGELGPVMALTRNDAAVHEKDGIYTNISHGEHVASVTQNDHAVIRRPEGFCPAHSVHHERVSALARDLGPRDREERVAIGFGFGREADDALPIAALVDQFAQDVWISNELQRQFVADGIKAIMA